MYTCIPCAPEKKNKIIEQRDNGNIQKILRIKKQWNQQQQPKKKVHTENTWSCLAHSRALYCHKRKTYTWILCLSSSSFSDDFYLFIRSYIPSYVSNCLSHSCECHSQYMYIYIKKYYFFFFNLNLTFVFFSCAFTYSVLLGVYC